MITEIIVWVEHSDESLDPHEVANILLDAGSRVGYGQAGGKQDDIRITAWSVTTKEPI